MEFAEDEDFDCVIRAGAEGARIIGKPISLLRV